MTFLTCTGHDIWRLLNVCMFVFSAEGAVQNSPLHCRPYLIYRKKKKGQSQIKLSRKLCFCQKCIKSFSLYSYHVVFVLKFIFIYLFINFLGLYTPMCGNLELVIVYASVRKFCAACALVIGFVCGQQCCTCIGIVFF